MAGLKPLALAAEFTALYILLPVFFAMHGRVSPILPLMIISAAFAAYLYKSGSFDNSSFFGMKWFRGEALRISLLFTAIALLITACTAYFQPEHLFGVVRNNFARWCLILVLYPLLSVYPQEIIYRGFLFARYAPLFRSNRLLIHASAVTFAFAHIIYHNPVAPLMALIGGYIFSWTYVRTNSLMTVAAEHALYGCFLFTVGLGHYFYAGFHLLA